MEAFAGMMAVMFFFFWIAFGIAWLIIPFVILNRLNKILRESEQTNRELRLLNVQHEKTAKG